MRRDRHMLQQLAKAKMKANMALIGGVLIIVLLAAAFYYGRKLGSAELASQFQEKKAITEDVTGFEGKQKQVMEEKAIANGILLEAGENTRNALKSIYQVILMDDTYKEGYTLEFAEAVES